VNEGSVIENRNRISNRREYLLIYSLLLVFLAMAFILDIFLGSVPIRPSEVLNALSGRSEDVQNIIIMKFRLPKAITASLVGMALSVSGLQMQTLFRNPMAGPYVLGISSGASLGVAFVIMGFSSAAMSWAGNWLVVSAAWAGAGGVMLLIMFISARIRDIMTVLILGLMISGGISSLVTIMQYFSQESLLKAYVVWTMGSLGNLTGSQLNVMAISVAAGIIISLFSVKILNALLLGETYAGSIGMNIWFSRALVFTSTTILAGSVTAFCGPIGFIGIAVPHLVRMVFRRSDHRLLLPGTILVGSGVMLLSDIISQLPGTEMVLPVNAVTSLIGIPIVIWVIIRNHKYSEM
jgi:iron complex transport system permease protein